MTEQLLSVAEVNALDHEAFVARFGGVFEHSPWIAAAAWATRPFADLHDLHAKLVAVVDRASPEQHLALIRAHPDLVGRAALAGTLTRLSTGEQRAAGLDPDLLSPDEIVAFTEANAAYQARFAFPFVICARENKKASILDAFDRRLDNDRETEIATALAEIAKIAWLRLADAVEADSRQGTADRR